jgi:uncharacterized protein YndB with AHSA1/START domain
MGHLGGSASADIDAPIADVWTVVEDVATAPDWQGGLIAITPLERDDQGRPTLVESENDIKVRHVKTQVRFSYDGPTVLSWTQVKGDMKSVEGSWTLEDLGDGRTRLVTTSLFMTAEDRDGMLQSGMESGVNESYAALDRVLAAM